MFGESLDLMLYGNLYLQRKMFQNGRTTHSQSVLPSSHNLLVYMLVYSTVLLLIRTQML